jgi:DNA-binding transcriptional LysR family regulator
VLAELLAEHPGARLTISEQSTHEVEQRFSADGVALAVLPTLDPPLAPGMREKVLWREPLRVVVPRRHELAEAGAPVAPCRLVRHPLVVSGSCRAAEPEVLTMLAARGLAALPRARVDTPQAALEMVRAGVGIGVLNAVAVQQVDTSEVCILDVDDPEMVREVAAYWYDVLLETLLGKALHRVVLAAGPPAGAVALDGDAAQAQSHRQPTPAAQTIRRPPRR